MRPKTTTALCALLFFVAACGAEGDPAELPPGGGKADGVSTNAYFTGGVEANLPTAIVTRLTLALQQDWVEDHRSHWYSSELEDEEMRKVFNDDADLRRAFADVLGDEDALRKAYGALREILHNLAAIRYFEAELAAGSYREVAEAYASVRDDLLRMVDDKNGGRPPAGAKPTVIINIPAEQLQVFYANERYQRNQVVVGQPDYEGYDQNSKTRVGDHTIKEWVHCYSNADYPSWCDDKSHGAFGEWTAKLDRTYQYIHGTIGDGLLDWFAIKTAPGSHGCVRNQNSDISRVHDLAPEGSFVRKIYARTERTMRVERKDDDTWDGDSYEVSFFVTKHDNIYGYDTGSVPPSLPEALRLPGRPNGIYYPATGVVVGYAHPVNAVDSPISGSSSADACTQQGGSCMDVSSCGGTPVPGYCPGAANIQCCLP